jgi:hypothetical protein
MTERSPILLTHATTAPSLLPGYNRILVELSVVDPLAGNWSL